MADKKRAEFIIKGRVQGVGYRFFVEYHARNLNIKGYTRNLWDGSVEVIAEGDIDSIEILSEKLKVGPGHARVDSCTISYKDYLGEFSGFDIR